MSEHGNEPQSELRRELLWSLKELKEASVRVHEALNVAAGSFAVIRTLLEEERDIREVTDMIDPQPMRIALSESTAYLERARHQTQRALFRLLRSEGMTNADIARKWGISRQLVSRLVNEE